MTRIGSRRNEGPVSSDPGVQSIFEACPNDKSIFLSQGGWFIPMSSSRIPVYITDLNRVYLEREQLCVEIFGRGFARLDTGMTDSLIRATNYVEAIESRQGLKVACIEEVAYHMGFITAEQLVQLAREIPNEYGAYLEEVAQEATPLSHADESAPDPSRFTVSSIGMG
jgi:hypothetical protein